MAIAVGLIFCQSVLASSVTFGSGANQFTMEFVTIGNPGNVPDTTGQPNPAGAVAYTFMIGKYEVSREIIIKANAVAPLGITLNDMSLFGGNGLNRPATGVSWNEAARFVNWLNTSQGYQPAYKFAVQPGEAGYSANAHIQLWQSGDLGYNAANPFRNTLAHYFLPNVDEWYKAAYHNAAAGTAAFYFNYPTGSDTAPAAVFSGTDPNTAVYGFTASVGPADVTQAGGLGPYGTMGQAGNAYEWNETEIDLVNDSPSSSRTLRGGNYTSVATTLAAFQRGSAGPSLEISEIGFRVAAVPEPDSLALAVVGSASIGYLVRRRFRRTLVPSKWFRRRV